MPGDGKQIRRVCANTRKSDIAYKYSAMQSNDSIISRLNRCPKEYETSRGIAECR